MRPWVTARAVLLYLVLISPSVVQANSFTAVLSTGDEIVLIWGNPSYSSSSYDEFRSSDIVSITVNGTPVDLNRIPNRYLELDWSGTPYNLSTNPPPNGQEISTALANSIMGLYIDDNADTYLEFLSYGSQYSDVTNCSNVLCTSTITSSNNVTVSAFYYGLLNSAPTANAGADQTAVASAATVTLDGSGSTDPDTGDTLTYAWTKTAGAGCDLVEHKRSTTNVHSANTWGQ